MKTVVLARNAMATRFEIVLHGANEVALRAAGEEALEEIESYDSQLSPYKPQSVVARINALAAKEAVHVPPLVFRLLESAARYWRETGGAFDVTVGPLMRVWGVKEGRTSMPAEAELLAARALTGMHLVELDAERFTVRFTKPGVRLDLGSIGKGFALDCAMSLLREAGVESALIHGGTSSVCALGSPPGECFWKVAIAHPSSGAMPLVPGPQSPPDARTLAVVELRNNSLSVSAVWGRAVMVEGVVRGHVIDPRTGMPVAGALLSAVVTPMAMESDVLTTALLTLGSEGHREIVARQPGIQSLLLLPGEKPAEYIVEAHGIEVAGGGDPGVARIISV